MHIFIPDYFRALRARDLVARRGRAASEGASIVGVCTGSGTPAGVGCTCGILTAAYPKIIEGTGTWFLDHEYFKNWKNNLNGSLLWLQGKAGSGKTFLCTNVINDLRKNSSVFFYYFDTCDKRKVDYHGVVSSLLCQMNSREGKFLIAEDMDSTLLHLMAMIDAAYIIIDAIDECAEEDQGKLLALIDKLLTKLKNCFVLVSSRPHINIARRKAQVISLDKQMSDVGITSDIEKYVDTKLQKQCAWSPELKAEVKDTLVNGASGQIRWVDCQLTALNEIKMPRGVRKALKSLPKTLQETYAKILEQVKDGQKDYVKTIFQWLLFAYRPLTLGEVQHILAIDVEEEKFQPEDLLENIEIELHNVVNSSLVVIIQDSIEKDRWNKQNVLTVQLAHPSVKDYLLSEAAMQSVSGYFQINSALVHEAICQMCIVYPLCCGQEAIDEEKSALAHYEAKHWFEHFNQSKEESPAAFNLGCQLMNSKQPPYGNWLVVYTPDTWDNRPRDRARPLYYASYIGLESLVAASYNGSLNVVRALLEKGANVNAQGGAHRNALHAASSRGHLEVVRAPLEKGADVNAQGGHYRNTLQAASSRGHLEVVRALLEKGADINAQGGHYGNALQASSSGGHLEVVRALLEKGADINAQGGDDQNTLQAASSRGHLEVAAISRGHLKVVRALLEKGTDVNAQGGGYGNALQATSSEGHLEVVRALLEKGADVNAQDGHDGNALQAASSGGHLEVVRALLEKGANVNAQGGCYGNSLQAAISRGHLEVARALLEKGADIKTQGRHYGNPLQAASDQGDLKVVEVLLEKGAAINAPGGEYPYAAQSNGNSEIIAALNARADDT
ncbi:hypothetical protein D9758_014604 [Tetrapyrgos nigripes]|uniref:NACHT domain-containing protein n=1 Tax=Tetrapyrgos nigripes TaxID=182062 RepID=A0A8H5CX01_9AGAR|nr:hypothetical protein D9758_014604 [Tetrapyrgos nigripes]